MKYEKCETCGDIDYGKWGTLGVIGYSLIVGMLGYSLSQIFYADMIAQIAPVIVGVILFLPAYWISIQEERKKRRLENNDAVTE